MKGLSIAGLRNRLRDYLRPRIDPTDAEWLARLERRGVIRRGRGTLSAEWIAARPSVGADVVATLLDAREHGP
jgi:hypothetical protein